MEDQKNYLLSLKVFCDDLDMVLRIVTFIPTVICLIWAILLSARSRGRNRAKLFLALFMAVAAILYGCHTAYFNHYNSALIDTLYIAANLSVYPLYLLYTKKLTSTAVGRNRSNLLFILPIATTAIVALLYIIMPQEQARQFVSEWLYGKELADAGYLLRAQQWVHRITPFIFAGEVAYVAVVGTRSIITYNAELKRYYSSENGRSLRTIRNLMFAFVLTSILSMTVNVIGKAYFAEHEWILTIPSLLFGVMLFLLGLAGMKQDFSAEEFAREMLYGQNTDAVASIEKYRKIGERIETLFAAERPYLNNDYKLSDLANSLHTNRTYVSNTINSVFGCNFADYVNRYRVERAKQLLCSEKPKAQSKKNHTIYEEAGFQSESSFYRIFKEQTGMTPRQFAEKG